MSLQEALNRIRTVAETLDDEDPDKLEMLNIEGDYESLMEWALKKRNDFSLLAASTKELIDGYTIRKTRFEKKADSMKDIIGAIMNAAGERKYTGALATVSIRDNAPKPIVLDESLVPDEYFETKKSLQKSLVNQAVKDGYSIPGIGLDNGSVSLTIRIK